MKGEGGLVLVTRSDLRGSKRKREKEREGGAR